MPLDKVRDEVRPDRRDGWAGLGVALLSFFVGLLVAGVFGAVYAAVRQLNAGATKTDLGFSLVTSAGLWVGFLVFPVAWGRFRHGVAEILGLAIRWWDLPIGVAVGLASSVVTALVSSVILNPGQLSALEDKAGTVVGRAQGPVASVVLVVALCVITPLAEEVFFRGLLFKSLGRVAPLAVAAVGASLVFGLVHYDGKPVAGAVLVVQIGLLSLFGLALCVLTHRTGRLGAGIVAHATFNSITVVGLLVTR